MFGEKAHISKRIKELAREKGFSAVSMACAEPMEEEATNLKSWLEEGRQGEMQYLENHFEKRIDPAQLVPGTKSVVSLAYNYYNPVKQNDPEAPRISMYAYGRDYHKVIRKKLRNIIKSLEDEFKGTYGRGFVDSAPVLERDWAKRSGLGWIGKNTMLIHPKRGSYFFLAQLFLNVELEYDRPIKDYCGTCTKCIEACPTDAIDEKGYVMDGSKCISYLTIELKGQIPEEFSGKMDNWMFGCDICQEVCPWNRFSTPHSEPQFEPKGKLLEMTAKEWAKLDEETFNELFEGSAVKRTGYEGLKRNIRFLN
jgi:epoxyqueuosine reductase